MTGRLFAEEMSGMALEALTELCLLCGFVPLRVYGFLGAEFAPPSAASLHMKISHFAVARRWMLVESSIPTAMPGAGTRRFCAARDGASKGWPAPRWKSVF